MKILCPNCKKVEYTYGIGSTGSDAPINPDFDGGFLGLVYKCTKCGRKITPGRAGIFNVSLWGITAFISLFLALSFVGNIYCLVISVLVIVTMPFIGPFLYLPFVNYKEIHEHCHYHGVPYETMRREGP